MMRHESVESRKRKGKAHLKVKPLHESKGMARAHESKGMKRYERDRKDHK